MLATATPTRVESKPTPPGWPCAAGVGRIYFVTLPTPFSAYVRTPAAGSVASLVSPANPGRAAVRLLERYFLQAAEVEGVEQELEGSQRLGAVLSTKADEHYLSLSDAELDSRGHTLELLSTVDVAGDRDVVSVVWIAGYDSAVESPIGDSRLEGG